MFDQTAEGAVALLNTLLDSDPVMMNKLFAARFFCNEAIADHPTVQVRGYKQPGDTVPIPNVGMLGVLNGLFGANASGYGVIEATMDAGKIQKFVYNPTAGS